MGTTPGYAGASDVSARTLQLQEALVRVRAGDHRAFGELYDVMAPRVLGLVRRVLVDRAQSEEVTQEVFLEIWQNASRFDANRGKPAGWMMTIAHRRAIDRVRASHASRERDRKVALRDLEIEHDCVAEAGAISLERRRLAEALRELSPLQREAVTLAYFGGFTSAEIADRVGAPVSTVKSRLREGLIRLRSVLSDEFSAC